MEYSVDLHIESTSDHQWPLGTKNSNDRDWHPVAHGNHKIDDTQTERREKQPQVTFTTVNDTKVLEIVHSSRHMNVWSSLKV